MAEKEAIFAAGCFWSIEDTFRKMPGVKDAISGYTGGETVNPTYQQSLYRLDRTCGSGARRV